MNSSSVCLEMSSSAVEGLLGKVKFIDHSSLCASCEDSSIPSHVPNWAMLCHLFAEAESLLRCCIALSSPYSLSSLLVNPPTCVLIFHLLSYLLFSEARL